MELAVFDLDGTLVDSRRDLATAANAMVRELGGAPLSEEAVGNMVGEGAALLVRRALKATGLPENTPEALERFLDHYDQHLLDTTVPYEGMVDLLRALSGRLPLAVLTNKPQAATGRLLDGLGLTHYFKEVVGGDTHHRRKPDPAGLLHLIANLGASPDTTMLIGDSPIDRETARRAGTHMCIAAYGFGFRSGPLEPAERIVHAPREIANLF